MNGDHIIHDGEHVVDRFPTEAEANAALTAGAYPDGAFVTYCPVIVEAVNEPTG